MQKEFTFNFSKVEVPEAGAVLNNNPLLQQAAFYTRFTIPELETEVNGIDKFSDRELELIRSFSNKPNSRKQYSIKDADRNQVFRNLGLEGMKNWLSKIKLDQTDITQSMLAAYINAEAPLLETQSLSQLIATHSICSWLKETGVAVPDEAEVLEKIRQLEILKPFQALTSNFKGRINELAHLSDYVDWTPKSTMTKSIAGWFRNIIKWHDKPPLMITGIGGSGKSTLVSKFILDQLKYNPEKKLPFIYFDFDKPGLSVSNPLELAIHALQQLSIHFPAHTSTFNHIREQLQNEVMQLESANQFSYTTNSRSSDRQVYYQKYSELYAQEISAIDRPVLVVFDSFEELQYRANTSEINALFSFIREISDIIPRLRPIFIGRAEVTYNNMRFESIKLEDFDQAAAVAFLEAKGVNNQKLGEIIYKKVGGNPLTLTLMADLVEGEKITDPAEIENIIDKMDKTLLQGLIVERNLNHAHDANTAKIAVPGILVRKINPDIIQQVLSEPCGFKDMDEQMANNIFTELNKESFLVTPTSDGISFRQDLRMALYNLIMSNKDYNGMKIHENAVKYYKEKTDPQSRAETLYHCLMRGDDPDSVDYLYDGSVRPYIENSLPELPDDAYLYLSRKMGIRAADSKVTQASLLEWENYQQGEIKSIMHYGDEDTLREKRAELATRKERSLNSSLYYMEAKLETRLGNFINAEKIIERALQEIHEDDKEKAINLLLLRATIFEYQGDFQAAFETIANLPILQTAYEYIQKNDSGNLQAIVEGRLTWARLARRISEQRFDTVLNSIYNFIAPFETQIYSALRVVTQNKGLSALLPFPYKTYAERLYGHLEKDINFNMLFVEMDKSFSGSEKYLSLYKEITTQVKTNSDLERLLRKRYNLNLKEICEPAVFAVNLIDVVRFIEMAGNRSEFTDSAK